MKRINHKMFFGILVTALVLVAMSVPAKAASWDSTMVYYATTVTKYDVAVGDKLKGALDDTVRIVTTQNATPFGILIATDRSTALPMAWVTETVTNTVAMRGCAIGDVDGDGQNEIIVGHTSSPYGLKMVKWTGGAWVLTTILSSTSSYVGACYDIAIGDADNNSGTVNDIIFNTSSYGVMKARWNGATFDTTRVLYKSGSAYYGVAIGDFDAANAGNEIVTVNYNQYIYRMKWNGASFDTATIFYSSTDYDFYDCAVGDFDASNPGAEIAINNGYSSANAGVYELYGSGSTWTFAGRYVPGAGWSSSGEIAIGDFFSSNPGDEIVATSGGGTAYEARLVYGSGSSWFNEKIMGTGGSYDYGVALGNLNRYRPGTEIAVGGFYKMWESEQRLLNYDMAAISIDGVPGMIDAGSTITIKTTVKNFAEYYANAPVPVKFRIDGPGGYTYTDVDQATSINLPPAGTEQIVFSPDWTCPATLGNYTIKAWTELPSDEIPANDTVTYVLTAIRPGGLNEQFTGTTFPPPGWTVYNYGTTPGDPWIRYTAYFHSSPACAQIYYDVPNNDWLITPRVRVVSGDIFSFWWRTHSTSYTESLMVRVSTSSDVSDTSAYAIVGVAGPLTGNISWFNKQIDMTPWAGQDVYIAFWYTCNNNYGMGIDDVTGPYFPPQITVTPDSVYAEGYVNSFFDVFFNVANTGGGTLNYSTALSTPAGYLSIIPSSGSLGLGMSSTDTLRFNTTGLAGHYYDSLVITSNAGAKATNIIPIHLYVRMVPNIVVSPDSFSVGVEANGSLDTLMFINNTGNGELNYSIETEEWSKSWVVYAPHEPPAQEHWLEDWNPADKDNKFAIDTRRGATPTKGMGGPDAFGYRWIDSDASNGPIFSWIEINSIGTQVLPTDDGNVGPYAIGFPFEFYGVSFDSFRIAANGFVTFTSTSGTLTNATIPTTGEPNNLLALMWDDLRCASGGGAGNIYYHYDGSKLIVEYDHVIRYGQTTCPFTMEVILYPNGKIIYQYKEMGDGTCTYLNQATIGIENGTGTDGLEVVFNADYVHNNLAIKFSAAPSWLVFSPESGTAPAFGTDTIDVKFDAGGILGGELYGGFVVSSDDPDTPVDTVLAHMHIKSPSMTFSPDSIMVTADEGDDRFDVTLSIGNTGDGQLDFVITEGMPWLTIAPATGSVIPGDPAASITLTIIPDDLYAGHYHGELKVYSNDPNLQPFATYQVYLTIGPYPDIAVVPDSFYVGLYAGYTKDTTLKISNTGAGHLTWGIGIEEIGKGGDTTLFEGFESGTFPPTGWTVIDNDGGANTWTDYTSYYHSGTHSTSCRWETTTLWNDDWLITPRISVGSNDTLSFWYRAYSATWPESLEVRLSTTTADPSAFTHLLWAGSQLTNADWQEMKLEVGSKFSRGMVYIAFVYKGLYEFRIYLDDISIRSYAGPWMSLNPTSGVTDPASTENVGVHFSAVGVEDDMYANLWIFSNDPDENPILVPVHMAVLGPNYSVSPPETLVIDALEGQYTDGHVFMQNFSGHAPLAYKITDPVDWLSETPDTAEVPIDGAQDVAVTVDGNQLISGDYATKLYIKTNDFDIPNDTLVVIVHMGPPPDISVAPESLRVVVPGGSTSHATLTINNDGDGHLVFDISTEETGPKAAPMIKDRFSEILQSHASSGIMENIPPDSPMGLTGTSGDRGNMQAAPAGGGQIKAGGDTVFVQLPHDPSETWSMGTSDQGAGYKLYENFWGVTLPIKGLQFWGLCLKYSGGWTAGNPENLVFDINFYSDPPDDPTLPPTQLVCSYIDVVPPVIVNTGQLFSGYTMYMFGGIELNPLCTLEEGWVSIQSKSAGSGYDWLLWASAKTGDGFSYHEGGTNPRYYDHSILMTGGANWLVCTPEADTVDPLSSTDIDVLFDATNILGGDKYGDIVIASNDPDEDPVTVRAHMIIAGANYAVHPFELHINAIEDQITPANLVVSNPGGIGTLSFKMTWTAPWLTAIPDTADVLPDGSQNVTVRIDGNMLIAGDYYTEIMVKTNAANQQLDTIPVYVHVGPDPDVDMSVSSLSVGLLPGCDKDVALRVNNLGGGHLSFSTEIEGTKAEFVSVITQKEQQLNQVFGRNAQSKVSLPSAGTQIGRNGDVAPQLAPASSGAGLHDGSYTKSDVLLSEGFEGSWLPTGWTQIINNTGYQGTNPCTWSQMSTYYHSGAYSAGLWWDYYYQDEWLISPTFAVGAACTLSFWVYGYEGSTYGDHYYVMVTTNDGANWTPVFDMSALTGAAWNYYAYPYSVDLSAYAGQSIKLAWYAQDPTTDDGIWYAWLIDDVLVTSSGAPPPTCPFTVAPESDTLEPTSFFDLILSFDPSMFEECSEETVTCNLIITTNDPDEQTITVPVSSWLGRGDMFTPTCIVDIGDVVFLVNYILKGGPAPSPVCVGDMAQPHDSMVDMSDLIYLMQYLFIAGPPPAATPAVTPIPMQR